MKFLTSHKYSFKLNLILIFLIYLISHFLISVHFQTTRSDIFRYGIIAIKICEANEENALENSFEKQSIEYPPLAVFWMVVPALFINDVSQAETLDIWLLTFKLWYFIFDLIILLLLFYFFKEPSAQLKTEPPSIFIFAISGTLLFNFIYDRQDFWLGGVLFFAFILLQSRLHWLFSFFLLAIGINFKLVPLLLVPVFIIGSLPATVALSKTFSYKLVMLMLYRLGLLAAMVVLIFLPFYIWAGPAALDFLSYHSSRGVQLESTYSSLLMVLNYFGIPSHVTYNYGSFNIESALAPLCVKISPILVLLFLGAMFMMLIKSVHRCFKLTNSQLDPNDCTKLAQVMPQSFLRLSIAILLGAMALSKVLSPQYLLWVVPLFGLLSYSSANLKRAGITFVISCLLTMYIYPYIYFTDFVHDKNEVFGSITWAAPTFLATLILLLRNALIIYSAILIIKEDFYFRRYSQTKNS